MAYVFLYNYDLIALPIDLSLAYLAKLSEECIRLTWWLFGLFQEQHNQEQGALHTSSYSRQQGQIFSRFSKDFSLRPAWNAPSSVGVVELFKNQQEAKIPNFPFPGWLWRAQLWKRILMLNCLLWHNCGTKKISFAGVRKESPLCWNNCGVLGTSSFPFALLCPCRPILLWNTEMFPKVWEDNFTGN